MGGHCPRVVSAQLISDAFDSDSSQPLFQGANQLVAASGVFTVIYKATYFSWCGAGGGGNASHPLGTRDGPPLPGCLCPTLLAQWRRRLPSACAPVHCGAMMNPD